MPNPTNHATTIGWLIGLKEHVFKSEAEWMKFVKGLAANRPMFVASLRADAGADRERREAHRHLDAEVHHYQRSGTARLGPAVATACSAHLGPSA